MNLTLSAGGTCFTLIQAAGQGPRNPRALGAAKRLRKKAIAYGNAERVLRVGHTESARVSMLA